MRILDKTTEGEETIHQSEAELETVNLILILSLRGHEKLLMYVKY